MFARSGMFGCFVRLVLTYICKDFPIYLPACLSSAIDCKTFDCVALALTEQLTALLDANNP
jgi:hypothetical protein